MQRFDLPPLDAHAHIAADVTAAQVRGLEPAVVFAMTRSVKEGLYTLRRDAASSENLVWGLGSHPGVAQTVTQFDGDEFAKAVGRFALIGEVGLDRRGDAAAQIAMFRAVLRAAADQSVLLSVHSTGRCATVLDELERAPHPGVLLHWFNGSAAEVSRAVGLGCYFSVNAAMSPASLERIPLNRTLTETDFPASRTKTGATRPGDVARIEAVLAALHGPDVRVQVWANLAEICRRSGATERMPMAVRAYMRTASSLR
ncbi:TatD family deoxyribonuclease [Mycobacteroides abscessus subsp. abscessus]|uniref:TatD family hydrolase n=1 Tax=Mycobacteroides abscessus TaxID=36809 RepID=UPI00092AA7B5|nr:TatD family hydrolase [Mycobacteroides abscessus]SIK94835.1 TatD family deoxyribonuclease [Mycobacteroides abscessus subsp. abscessus]SLC90168.1 TatD family deoxyribonuclease [Mycobacteroides abscessus subsp. abscessus]